MCLAIPGRIVSILESEGGTRTATVEYPGLSKTVSLLYVPEAKVGDFMLVQAGFGIRLLTEAQAQEVFEAMESSGVDSQAEPTVGVRP